MYIATAAFMAASTRKNCGMDTPLLSNTSARMAATTMNSEFRMLLAAMMRDRCVRPRYPVAAFPSAFQIMRHDTTILIPDLLTDMRLDESLRNLYTQQFQGVSTIFVPLVVAGQWLGYLNVIFDEPNSFPTPLVNQFENVVQQAAVTIQGIYLNEQREKARLQTEALYEGSSRVVRATSVEEVLDALIQSSALQRMDRASIFYFNRPWESTRPPDTTQVLTVWEREPGTTRLPVGTIYPYTQFHNQQFSRDEPRVYREAQEDERISPNTKTLLQDTGMRGLMYLPLVVNESWVGVVAITSREPMEVSEEELRQLTSLTSQASVVLANRRLLTEAQARADRERQVRAITDRIRRGGDRESILQIAREEIAGLLKASSTVVQLGTKEQLLETMKQDRV
jgi:GAF domain-containing protein